MASSAPSVYSSTDYPGASSSVNVEYRCSSRTPSTSSPVHGRWTASPPETGPGRGGGHALAADVAHDEAQARRVRRVREAFVQIAADFAGHVDACPDPRARRFGKGAGQHGLLDFSGDGEFVAQPLLGGAVHEVAEGAPQGHADPLEGVQHPAHLVGERRTRERRVQIAFAEPVDGGGQGAQGTERARGDHPCQQHDEQGPEDRHQQERQGQSVRRVAQFAAGDEQAEMPALFPQGRVGQRGGAVPRQRPRQAVAVEDRPELHHARAAVEDGLFQTGQLRRAAQAGFVGKALRAFPRRLSGGKMMYCPCSVDEEGRCVGEPRQFVQRVPYPRHDQHEPGPAVLRIAGQGFGVEHGGVRSVFGKAVEQAPPAGRFSGGRDERSQVFQFLPIDRAVVGAEQPRFAPVSRRDAEHGKIRDERARDASLSGYSGKRLLKPLPAKTLRTCGRRALTRMEPPSGASCFPMLRRPRRPNELT